MGDLNAGALFRQQAKSRGGAQTKFCDGKILVAGESPPLRNNNSCQHRLARIVFECGDKTIAVGEPLCTVIRGGKYFRGIILGMEILNLVLDFFLIVLSLWMISLVTGYGGVLGKSFTVIGWGSFILGIAHLTETLMIRAFEIPNNLVEFSHRIIVLVGFALVVIGFRMFVRGK